MNLEFNGSFVWYGERVKVLVRSWQSDRQMQLELESSLARNVNTCVENSIAFVKFQCSTKSMMSVFGYLKTLVCFAYKEGKEGEKTQMWTTK